MVGGCFLDRPCVRIGSSSVAHVSSGQVVAWPHAPTTLVSHSQPFEPNSGLSSS